MKLIRINGSASSLRRSRFDWQKIGQQNDWLKPEDDSAVEPLRPLGQEADQPYVIPILDQMEIKVEKYTDRTWAVYVNGKLLCVTAYKKGAYSVMEMVNQLWNRILRQEAEVRTLSRGREATLGQIRDRSNLTETPIG